MLVKTVTGVLLPGVLPNHLTVVLSLPRKGTRISLATHRTMVYLGKLSDAAVIVVYQT